MESNYYSMLTFMALVASVSLSAFLFPVVSFSDLSFGIDGMVVSDYSPQDGFDELDWTHAEEEFPDSRTVEDLGYSRESSVQVDYVGSEYLIGVSLVAIFAMMGYVMLHKEKAMRKTHER